MGSRNSTGSGSRTALASSPFASAAVDGTTTLMPGVCVYGASTESAWCSGVRTPPPYAARTVTGQWKRLRLRYRMPRQLPDDLVVRLRAEARELDLGDRHHARNREADARADDRRLRDRRVEHSGLTEPVEQTVGDPEDAAVVPDVLAEQDDAVVACHLVRHRVADGGEHRHARHEMLPPSDGSVPSPPSRASQLVSLSSQTGIVVRGDVVERGVRIDGVRERGVDDPLERAPRLRRRAPRAARRPTQPASVSRARRRSIGSRFLPCRELGLGARSAWGRRSWCARPCGR